MACNETRNIYTNNNTASKYLFNVAHKWRETSREKREYVQGRKCPTPSCQALRLTTTKTRHTAPFLVRRRRRVISVSFYLTQRSVRPTGTTDRQTDVQNDVTVVCGLMRSWTVSRTFTPGQKQKRWSPVLATASYRSQSIVTRSDLQFWKCRQLIGMS